MKEKFQLFAVKNVTLKRKEWKNILAGINQK
jgi:hypothetical protein